MVRSRSILGNTVHSHEILELLAYKSCAVVCDDGLGQTKMSECRMENVDNRSGLSRGGASGLNPLRVGIYDNKDVFTLEWTGKIQMESCPWPGRPLPGV